MKNAEKKVLLIGGTGAMGTYLAPELVKRNCLVDVVSLDDVISDNENLRYFKANAHDDNVRKKFLENGYDVIVDFLIYPTDEFKRVHAEMLSKTDHYIYLSTYRVYAGEHPITEKSPRLLDVSDDSALLASEDYCMYKARQEDILKSSGADNWTIVRPSITFSKFRYQLVTLEANIVVNRALDSKTVVVPAEAMSVQSTMTWAHDTAKMFCAIIFNRNSFAETYTLATAEHQPWSRIAQYYEQLIGLKIYQASKQEYLDIIDPARGNGAKWQLEYDRMFEREVDNSKILKLAGMTQSDLTPVYKALETELSAFPKDFRFGGAEDVCGRMDEFLKNKA